MTTNITEIENRLWGAADQLWANSGLASARVFTPCAGVDVPTLCGSEVCGDGAGVARAGKGRVKTQGDHQVGFSGGGRVTCCCRVWSAGRLGSTDC
jgi:hypothetical protein